jgi:hypothetical protein
MVSGLKKAFSQGRQNYNKIDLVRNAPDAVKGTGSTKPPSRTAPTRTASTYSFKSNKDQETYYFDSSKDYWLSADGKKRLNKRAGIRGWQTDPNRMPKNTQFKEDTAMSQKKTTNEGLGELADMAERDHEVQMARAQLYKLAKYSIKLHDMLKGVTEAEGIEGWQQAKITKASDYISSVYHALDYDMKFEGGKVAEGKSPHKKGSAAYKKQMAAKHAGMNEYKENLKAQLAEKAVSKSQQQAAGVALAAKRKGQTPKGKGAAADMAKMSTKELEKFAGTKHKGLPKKKTSESSNRQAKRILGEGKEYQVYLQLSEAPIGDVVNKIKTGLAKMPKQAAAKATSLIKKVPKSAWPIAAGVVLAMAGADPAAAGDLATLADGLEKLEQLARELGPTSRERAQAAAQAAADAAQGGANAAQGAVEITRDQLKSLYRELGGGTAPTLTNLIQNNVDTDAVKNLLTRFGITDSIKIEQALQQIDGDNLKPMVDWLARNR